jgi:ArsR family transcriptional regulator
MELSEIFRVLEDETRLRILNLLSQHELCVCIIKEVLDIPQPSVSKHLQRLKTSGLIRCRKVSQWCFFSISEPLREGYAQLFEFLTGEWERGEKYAGDREKLGILLDKNDCCEKLLQKAKRPGVALTQGR